MTDAEPQVQDFDKQLGRLLTIMQKDKKSKQRNYELYLSGSPTRDNHLRVLEESSKMLKLEELKNVDENSLTKSFEKVLQYLLFMRLQQYYIKGSIVNCVRVQVDNNEIVSTHLNVCNLTKKEPSENQLTELREGYKIKYDFQTTKYNDFLLTKFGFQSGQLYTQKKYEVEMIDDMLKYDDNFEFSNKVFFSEQYGTCGVNEILRVLSEKKLFSENNNLIWKFLQFCIQSKQAITDFIYIPKFLDAYVTGKTQLPSFFLQGSKCTLNTLKYVLGISPDIEIESEVKSLGLPSWIESRFQQLKWVCFEVNPGEKAITEGVDLKYDASNIEQFVYDCYY